MSRPSKWFVVRQIEQPAIEVARRCLRNRLRHVWRMLRAATFHNIERLEAVHLLRVATRRASTALDLFEPVQQLAAPTLASEDRVWVAKQLKKLRRAAGEARDADVLRLYYQRVDASDQPPRRLRQLLDERSTTTRQPVRKLLAKLRHKHFPTRVQATLRELRVTETPGPTFREFARESVGQLWQTYRAAAATDMRDIDRLHEFRILTKEFRYALELFASALPKQLSELLYPRVSELQEALGTINDHAVAINFWSSQQESLAGKKSQAWLNRELPQRAAALQLAHEKFLASWPHQWQALVNEWQALDLEAAKPVEAEQIITTAAPFVESSGHPLCGTEWVQQQPALEYPSELAPPAPVTWPESATPMPWQTS